MTDAAGFELKQSWSKIAQRLKAELGDDLYTSWFARMEPEACADGRLAVSVPTRFLRNWIETHYAAKLLKASEAELGHLDNVNVKVRTRGVPQRPQDVADRRITREEQQEPAGRTMPVQALHQPAAERGSPLDPNQTFQSFITGGSNRLAHAAAQRISESQPGLPVSFNPLFIHSAAGLGKTHLLNAIAWRVRERHRERKVLFITAERFMYHFIGALRSRDTIGFKDFFQSIDVKKSLKPIVSRDLSAPMK